jgi:hypothetical protein
MTVRHTLILGITTLLLVSNCKKGPDDPAISLRTRKARAAGEWRLVSGNASYTTNGYNETYDFSGTDVTVTTTLYYPAKAKYLLGLTIKKDGTFSFNEMIAGSTVEASGDWSFNKGGGEDKKKEDFIFTITQVSTGSTGDVHFFNRLSTNFVYKIKELRDKKLVIHSAGTLDVDSKGNYGTLSTEYTFQQ